MCLSTRICTCKPYIMLLAVMIMWRLCCRCDHEFLKVIYGNVCVYDPVTSLCTSGVRHVAGIERFYDKT